MTDARITLDAAALDLLHDENAHDLLGNYPEVISQARAALALRDELAAAKKQESAQTTAAQRAWLAADTLRNELAECQQKHAACDDCLDNTKAELAECRALVQLHMDDSAVNAREADDLRAKLAQAEQTMAAAAEANVTASAIYAASQARERELREEMAKMCAAMGWDMPKCARGPVDDAALREMLGECATDAVDRYIADGCTASEAASATVSRLLGGGK